MGDPIGFDADTGQNVLLLTNSRDFVMYSDATLLLLWLLLLLLVWPIELERLSLRHDTLSLAARPVCFDGTCLFIICHRFA